MATRESCEGKIGKALEECLMKIEDLAGKAGEMDAAQNAELSKGLEALRSKRKDVWNKFQRMKSAGENEWENHREKVENSMLALQEAMDRSYSRFKQ